MRILFLFALFVALSSSLYAANPAITRPVNDYAGILSPYNEKKISDLIIAHREKTGVQIAVLTVASTGKTSIEKYSLETANKWEGGSRQRNDGILFTVAVNDRRMRLEVGKGLTGMIHDAEAQQILNAIRDDFKKKLYGRGVTTVIEKISAETDELRPGESIPFKIKIIGYFFRISSYYIFYFLLGLSAACIFRFIRNTEKYSLPAAIAGYLLIWIPLPVLLQLYYPGVYYWKPILYLSGAYSGTTLATAFLVKGIKNRIWPMILTLLPCIGLAASTFYFIDHLKPDPYGTTEHETYLLIIVIAVSYVQIFTWMVAEAIRNPEAFTGSSGGGYSDSGGSSSSGGDSSSSSDSKWSGGGGSFGGGGASSSW